MKKTRMTYDESVAIRGIGVVSAPNRHPGRSAWRAQRPRYSTTSHLRQQSVRRVTRKDTPQEAQPFVPRTVHTSYDGVDFTLYRDPTTLALALVQEGYAIDRAKKVLSEFRHYMGGKVSEHIVEVSLGAGRGW